MADGLVFSGVRGEMIPYASKNEINNSNTSVYIADVVFIL